MTHPRDAVLCLAAQLRGDYTDVTKATVKVRVNGGAATTYTNVSVPAVTQAQDCTFGYHLELPAGSFAAGDRVSRTWLYNGVAVAYGDTIIGPASVDGGHYTAARGDKLDDLDATISSRATDAHVVALGAPAQATDARLAHLDADISTRAAPADVDVKVNADLGPLETTAAAIKAKTDLLGTAAVAVTSPVSATGNVAIVSGDDYRAADSRALQWAGSWPSLAGATIALTLAGSAPSYAGSAAVVGSGQVATVELTAAQTGPLASGRYAYTLSATLAGGHEITLARGPLTVS